MIHRLKVKQCYLIHVLENKKGFEVRKNDRDFQVGDTINYLPIEDEDYDAYEFGLISDVKITYVHQGLGMMDGYAVLGIGPLDDISVEGHNFEEDNK